MKVAIIGSRSITQIDWETILCHLPEGTDTIISGGAVGVDSLAEAFAREHGFQLIKILPDYDRFGKKAPLLRNREIVKHADYVLAIWDFSSRGTADVIARCVEAGIPVRVIGEEEPPDAIP